jgi:hypothetical protein
LALVELDGKWAQPLTGKSRSAAAAEAPDPREDSSLLLEIPLEMNSEQLPVFKTDWMSGGETAVLLRRLQGVATRGWRLSTAKDKPVLFLGWT